MSLSRKVRTLLSLGLIIGGAILSLTPVWTWLYGLAGQARLLAQEQNRPAPQEMVGAEQNAPPTSTPVEPTGTPEERSWPFTRLVIPKLGLDAVVVEGVDEASLRRGPGHFPGTAMPGEQGNVGIAGHRNAWGRWFKNLHKLEPGDNLSLVTETATYRYRVTGKWITHAYDWSVVEPTPSPSLTLITCELPVQKKQRLVVRAVLVTPPGDTEP